MTKNSVAADNDLLRSTTERIGANIMGKRMFDQGEIAWPEEAPFHTPVYVLTNQKREPWMRPGGTTFYFVNEGPERALELARQSAGGRDIRIALKRHAIATLPTRGNRRAALPGQRVNRPLEGERHRKRRELGRKQKKRRNDHAPLQVLAVGWPDVRPEPAERGEQLASVGGNVAPHGVRRSRMGIGHQEPGQDSRDAQPPNAPDIGDFSPQNSGSEDKFPQMLAVRGPIPIFKLYR